MPLPSESVLVYSTETPVYCSQVSICGGTSFIWTTDKNEAISHAKRGYFGSVSVPKTAETVYKHWSAA